MTPSAQLSEAGAAPVVSHRHLTGAESARGLLFTVLGEFVLPSGGSSWTSAFIDVLGRLGVEEKASRQALMRTAAAGWLVSQRVGRRTRWRLTENAERLLVEGTARIYGFTPVTRDWDGRWALVLARVPESDRPARHLLRSRLARSGFGSVAPGVWISTHTERVEDVEQLFEATSVFDDARVFLAEYRGGGDLVTMVCQAWDLDAIDAGYREFRAEFVAPSAADPLARTVELVHAWRAFPWSDPALPRELLPAGWSGDAAAALFAERHASWTAAARAEWLRLDESGG